MNETAGLQSRMKMSHISGNVQSLQYDATNLDTRAIKGTSREELLDELAWVKLKTRPNCHKLVMIIEFHIILHRHVYMDFVQFKLGL